MKTVVKVTLTRQENGWNHYDVRMSDGTVEKIDGWYLRASDAGAFVGWQFRK